MRTITLVRLVPDGPWHLMEYQEDGSEKWLGWTVEEKFGLQGTRWWNYDPTPANGEQRRFGCAPTALEAVNMALIGRPR